MNNITWRDFVKAAAWLALLIVGAKEDENR